MDLATYQRWLDALPFGKRTGGAVYLYRLPDLQLPGELQPLLERVIRLHSVPDEFNLLKFKTAELKLSFLSYPDFFSDPHPVLRKAITIDLVSGKARTMDYRHHSNPPILHRKETFLPPDHPRAAEFARLTQAEETEGLYANPSTIGFKLNWDRLLRIKGLGYDGHCLRKTGPEVADPEEPPPLAPRKSPLTIHRHKTALTRYDFPNPVNSHQSPISRLCGQNPSNPPARILNVAMPSRDNMNMGMRNSLSRSSPLVNADIKTIRPMCILQQHSDPTYLLPHMFQLDGIKLEQ